MKGVVDKEGRKMDSAKLRVYYGEGEMRKTLKEQKKGRIRKIDRVRQPEGGERKTE